MGKMEKMEKMGKMGKKEKIEKMGKWRKWGKWWKRKRGENGENGEKFVKLVKPKHYNSLSAAGAQAAVCSSFGGRLSHDVNSHSINLIVGLLVYYMEATLRCYLHL